jgi:hypothetical protein
VLLLLQFKQVKKMKKIIIAAVALFVLSACGSSTAVKNQLNFGANAGAVKYKIAPITHDKIAGNVDEKITDRIVSQLTEILQGQNMLQAGSGQAYTVAIDLVQYRVKNGSLRFFTGAMSGEEFIESVVTVKDSSGKSFGSATVRTYNVSAFNTMAAQHAKEIAAFLTKK